MQKMHFKGKVFAFIEKGKKEKEMSASSLASHKNTLSHDDKVCDESLRNRTVQMSQFWWTSHHMFPV